MCRVSKKPMLRFCGYCEGAVKLIFLDFIQLHKCCIGSALT